MGTRGKAEQQLDISTQQCMATRAHACAQKHTQCVGRSVCTHIHICPHTVHGYEHVHTFIRTHAHASSFSLAAQARSHSLWPHQRTWLFLHSKIFHFHGGVWLFSQVKFMAPAPVLRKLRLSERRMGCISLFTSHSEPRELAYSPSNFPTSRETASA